MYSGDPADFGAMKAAGINPVEAVNIATKAGVGRLIVFKGLQVHFGLVLDNPNQFANEDTGEYPSVAAREAATVGLGALVYTYKRASEADVRAFDRATGLSRKVDALARAGRVADALAFYDRMSPSDLSLASINEADALALAEAHIAAIEGPELRIQEESTQRHSFGWMFFYQSAGYLDTGNFSLMVAGNAPLIVDRFTSAVWVTDTADRPTTYVENYERTGSPFA